MAVTPNAGIKPITIALKVNMDDAQKQALAAANETTNRVVQAYNRLGTLKVAALGGAISAIGGMATALVFGIGAASRFEESFAGIKKTVDASEEEFDRLAVSIRQLATEIPIATSQLNQIGELGGQLGIEASGLPIFIDTIAKLGVATRLSTETASLSLARLKEIFQLQEFEIANLGSALVDLGNNFAALEDEILSTSLRLAAGAKVAGASAADTLAIATALQAVGVQSQAGGTAMSRVFQQLTVAVQGNQRALNVFVETTGLTTEAFKQIASEDPAQALNLFIQGLSRVANSGGNVVAILDELGLKQQRTIRALLSVAEAGDLLTDALARSNVAYEINNALNEEAEKRFDTLKSQTKTLKNAFQELRIQVGNDFLNFTKSLVQSLEALVGTMSDTEDAMDGVAKGTKIIVGTFTVLGTAISAIAGQFFAVRALAQMAGATLAEMTVAAKASTGAFMINEVQVNKNAAAYLRLSTAIRGAMGSLLPALTLITIGLGANAAANAKMEDSARKLVGAQSALIPLQATLNQKMEEYQKLLADPNIDVSAIDVLKREIEIVTEELEILEAQALQTFYNLPKFRTDFSLVEIVEYGDAFAKVVRGTEELTDAQKELNEIAGIDLFQNVIGNDELVNSMAEILKLSPEDLLSMLETGDLSDLTNSIYRAILIDPKAAEKLSGELNSTLYMPVGKAIYDLQGLIDTRNIELSPNLQLEFAQVKKDVSGFENIITRIGAISDEEIGAIEDNLIGLLDSYNATAEEMGFEIISISEFVNDAEKAAIVLDVVAGKFDKVDDSADSVSGRVNDVVSAITSAVAEAENLDAIFEGIGDIEFPDPKDMLQNIEDYENAQKFLQIAVTEFADRGLLAISRQVGEAGVTSENIGRTMALLSKDIPLADLVYLNEQLIASDEKYSDLAETNQEVLYGIEKSLRTQYGLGEKVLSNEEKRAVINGVISQRKKDQENHEKDVLGIVKELLEMKRNQVDTEKEIADLQSQVDNFNKDLVYDNITITSQMKEQMELDEATLALKEAIAEYGDDEVVTNKEQIAILQATLNIDRMREKLSKQRTARERKSIRDKQKEIKFLELAVEQGVAEQLDLDAAREELADLTKPMAQTEKDLLDLQLKVAEAEKEILEERSKNLSPAIISAIENYNSALNIGKTRADELAKLEDDLSRKIEDANIAALEQGLRLDEIGEKYPGLQSHLAELSTLIGIPAGILEETLNSYDDSYNGFLSIAKKIKAVVENGYTPSADEVNTDDDGESTQMPKTNWWTRGQKGDYDRIINGIPIHADPTRNPFYGMTQSEIDREWGLSSSLVNPYYAMTQSEIDREWALSPYEKAYGGSVPIGKTSIVGEMGPELIMSTPGGTSVFSNKTGGGYGGITVENMNVNITGLPADPISARKAAINIRKELTKLEKEGNAGTGLRNR